MNISTRDAVLCTVLYADVFDHPLTQESLVSRLLFTPKKHLFPPRVLRSYGLTLKDDFVVFPKRVSIVAQYKQRQQAIGEKWHHAHRVSSLLSCVPTIECLCVTGGLAADNIAGEGDDIDFLVITSAECLFVTRFLIAGLLSVFGMRRKPGDIDVRNKACVNMYMDSSDLAFGTHDSNVYIAYELLLMKPLWQRSDVYERLLWQNRWAQDILPNAYTENMVAAKGVVRRSTSIWIRIAIAFLKRFECVLRYFQQAYMKQRQTSETVTATRIQFHPHDAKQWIRQAYVRRLSKHNISLDNFWDHR